jgi:hypothetical protein
MHKRPLSYLFALLKSPKLEKSDKKIVDSLIKGLRKSETAFMKENGVKQSIIDKLLKQRKLKLEAASVVTAREVSEKGAERMFKRLMQVVKKQWGIDFLNVENGFKADWFVCVSLKDAKLTKKQAHDLARETGWVLSKTDKEDRGYYYNKKYSGAAMVIDDNIVEPNIMFVVLKSDRDMIEFTYEDLYHKR